MSELDWMNEFTIELYRQDAPPLFIGQQLMCCSQLSSAVVTQAVASGDLY